MSTSSLFLNDTTNIDHAYINEKGEVVGGSYRPKFLVSGKVDPVENVVVDFSTIKKTIKNLIDDKEYGFDHKLWWIEGFSQGTATFDGDRVVIDTDAVHIEGPSNIVRVIPEGTGLNEYLESELRDLYPQHDIDVVTELTTAFDLPVGIDTKAHAFRYVHGLRESSSWGCQNIGHGHLSYMAAMTHDDPLEADMLLAKIAAALDGAVFVWKQNQTMEHDVVYECSRGQMIMDFRNESNTIVLDTETTVEHLVEMVASVWEEQLRKAGIFRLYMSEGLSKGACVDL